MNVSPALRRTYQDCGRVMANLGLIDLKGGGLASCRTAAELADGRMDANEVMATARQLEAVKAEVIDDEYPELKGKALVPEEPGIDPGAQSFTFPVVTRLGLFKFIANYATDLPRVDGYVTETNSPIRQIGGAYGYTTEDLRAAAMLKRPLSPLKAKWAREAYERKVDNVLALGDTTRGIPGLLKNSAVPIITSGITGGWLASATAAEILADLFTLSFAVWNQSLQTHTPSTLLLSPRLYAKVATKQYSTMVPTSLLKIFLEGSPFIREVVPWLPCEGAAANGTNDRAMVYTRDPKNLAYVESLKFQSLPPQARGFEMYIPCEGKVGGTIMYRPFSAAYCDVLN